MKYASKIVVDSTNVESNSVDLKIIKNKDTKYRKASPLILLNIVHHKTVPATPIPHISSETENPTKFFTIAYTIMSNKLDMILSRPGQVVHLVHLTAGEQVEMTSQ